MTVAARTAAWVETRRTFLGRIRLGTTPLLAGIVVGSFTVRALLGWLRHTPSYFQDEYLYAELGRSLAEAGRPLVRGASADFPSLLQPVLTAPAWLLPDVETAYRAIQVVGALSISLAAVPAFLLARQLGLGRGYSLMVASLAVAIPDLVFGTFVLSEPFAYPLVLAAVTVGTAALATPTRRTQLVFVALALLATLARIQFAALPLCFLLAAVIVGVRSRRVRRTLREQALPLALFALPAAALPFVHERVLGAYGGALGVREDPLALLEWALKDAMIFLYDSGWILAPGAILGLGLALARPRSPRELAFGAFAACLFVTLLLQAGLVAANDFERPHGRYVFYAVPLLAVSFALYASRGWPFRRAHALLAAGLVLLALRVPLSGFTPAELKDHSPLLWAAFELEEVLGSPGNGALAIAIAATLLSVAAVGGSFRPRTGTTAVLGLALLATGIMSVAAARFELGNAAWIRASFLPAEPSWVDRAELGEVALLQAPGGLPGGAFEQLFWNRSVSTVLLLPGAEPFDAFAAGSVELAEDGSLFVAGRPVEQPLLVDEYAATVRLRGATIAATAPYHTLWRPQGRPRLALYAPGRYRDGWLAGEGNVMLWPEPGHSGLAGRLEVVLTAPRRAGPALTVRFQPSEGEPVAVRLRPGDPTPVALPVCSQGPWRTSFAAPVTGLDARRFVSVHSSELVFRPDAAACAPASPAITA